MANLSCKFRQLIDDFFFFNSHVAYQMCDILDPVCLNLIESFALFFKKVTQSTISWLLSSWYIISVSGTPKYTTGFTYALFLPLLSHFLFIYLFYTRGYLYTGAPSKRGVGGSRTYNELERVFQCENFEPGRKEAYRSRPLIHPPQKLSFQNWVTRISPYRKQVQYNLLDGDIKAWQ